LLKLLMGELQPQRGSIKWAEKARPVTTRRTTQDFNSDTSLTDWIAGYARANAADGDDLATLIRGTLGRLLFSGNEVRKAVKVISGGEQGRMIFGKLMLTCGRTCW
jgi:ATPase subunit of ABC transporter with duplicated ATPase domains